ncbi:hypothetical protein [Planctomonas deserti]|uniref:hypothetical protein n=1 Tax=Planctomonas deserti TaxID=2144185 RepID=UPI000D37D29C|nr:hypothetical protein [Planctomonas deserti]
MSWQPPWPPIRIGAGEWILMRDSRREPAAIVRHLQLGARREWYFRVVTWAETSAGRELVGYYRTLEEADQSVKFRPPVLSARSGPPNGGGSTHAGLSGQPGAPRTRPTGPPSGGGASAARSGPPNGGSGAAGAARQGPSGGPASQQQRVGPRTTGTPPGDAGRGQGRTEQVRPRRQPGREA